MGKTQLTKNVTTGNWELTETNQGQTYTNTLNVAGKAILGDIKLNISAKSGDVTASATKGTVSNNKVTVTPKATKIEGYINSGTISGTGVEVSASELVSGTITLTQQSGTDVTNYKYANVSNGTAGTPVATKGTASSNKITVTPKVTNSAGWVTTETITGTGVEVSASELVDGTITITQQTGTDVTNYASADVQSGSAPVATALSGSSATVSLSGANITLTKVVTNTGSTFTAGWIETKPTGNTTITLSGVVPTEVKSVTPNNTTQTITPSSGKLLSEVTVEPAPPSETTELTATPTTATQTFTPSSPYVGFNEVTVEAAPLTPLTVSGVTTYVPSSPYIGYDSVLVVAGNPSASVSSYVTPSVAISGAVTGMATATTSSYYVTISGNATNGSVKAKYTNTVAGYAVKNTTGTESAATTITPSITGSGTIYIKAGTITNNTSGGSSSGTINRGSQIKISSGYYGSNVYYTAQSNSGGVEATGATTSLNCDGKTYVSIASGAYSASASKGSATGSGSSRYITVTPKASIDTAGWINTGSVTGTGVNVAVSDLISTYDGSYS